MTKNELIAVLEQFYTKEKQEKDYSKYSFTDVSWTRDAENDIETIVFKSNGRFVYYC